MKLCNTVCACVCVCVCGGGGILVCIVGVYAVFVCTVSMWWVDAYKHYVSVCMQCCVRCAFLGGCMYVGVYAESVCVCVCVYCEHVDV